MARRLIWGFLLLVIYLVSSVPVGLFLYSLKSAWGMNVFPGSAGFHAYMRCIDQQLDSLRKEENPS